MTGRDKVHDLAIWVVGAAVVLWSFPAQALIKTDGKGCFWEETATWTSKEVTVTTGPVFCYNTTGSGRGARDEYPDDTTNPRPGPPPDYVAPPPEKRCTDKDAPSEDKSGDYPDCGEEIQKEEGRYAECKEPENPAQTQCQCVADVCSRWSAKQYHDCLMSGSRAAAEELCMAGDAPYGVMDNYACIQKGECTTVDGTPVCWDDTSTELEEKGLIIFDREERFEWGVVHRFCVNTIEDDNQCRLDWMFGERPRQSKLDWILENVLGWFKSSAPKMADRDASIDTNFQDSCKLMNLENLAVCNKDGFSCQAGTLEW